jgi:hypothetical protein
VPAPLTVSALERDASAEEHASAVTGCLTHDGHTLETRTQEAYATIDLTQAPFAVDVFGIFRAIA